MKPHKLLHIGQSRWLSLLQVVERLLEQLPALKLYFQGAVLNDQLKYAEPILQMCLDSTTELYLEFLKFVLPYFNNLNKEMQSESPKLYLLYENVLAVYKTIVECFLKSDFLLLPDEELIKIDFANEDNHLPLKNMYFGGNFAALLTKKKHNLERDEIIEIQNSCLQFYIESLRQLQNRFSFEDEELQKMKSLHFFNPATILNNSLKAKLPSIAHLGQMFPGTFFIELLTEFSISSYYLQDCVRKI